MDYRLNTIIVVIFTHLVIVLRGCSKALKSHGISCISRDGIVKLNETYLKLKLLLAYLRGCFMSVPQGQRIVLPGMLMLC